MPWQYRWHRFWRHHQIRVLTVILCLITALAIIFLVTKGLAAEPARASFSSGSLP
jgi:hypothetical protein